MKNAGGTVAESGLPRRRNISSATAADGKTSRSRSGMKWESDRMESGQMPPSESL